MGCRGLATPGIYLTALPYRQTAKRAAPDSNKTSNLVPEFAVEDLPLGRTAALVPEFAVKDPHWAVHSDDDP